MEWVSLILVACLVAVPWFAVCNELTYRQRQRMLNVVYDYNIRVLTCGRYGDRHAYPDDFMSYHSHLFRLFFFMNPSKAYSNRGWKLAFGF